MSSSPQPMLPPHLSPRRGSRAGWLRYGRAISWVAFATSLIVLLGASGVWAYYRHLGDNVTKLSKVFCVGKCDYVRPSERGSTENFLLVGTDSRAGTRSNPALMGLNGVGTDGQRSDTTLLVHISATSQRVVVLSFPRDMLVDRPSNFTDAGTGVIPSRGGPSKFNAAIAYGGPSLLVKQIEELSGLRVDHYVSVNLVGFSSIVQALGGIDVCLTADIRDPGDPSQGTAGSGFAGHKGINHLDGIDALAYVRQRDGLPGNDLGRIQRQHRFLAAIFKKVKSNGTLTDPLKLNHVLNAITSDISIDKQNTSLNDLTTLGSRLSGLSGSAIEYLTVPVQDGPNLPGIGAVQVIQSAKAKATFQGVPRTLGGAM